VAAQKFAVRVGGASSEEQLTAQTASGSTERHCVDLRMSLTEHISFAQFGYDKDCTVSSI